MDSLVGYGSDDENETERYAGGHSSMGGAGRRREDDTNYDDVNMDMSEDSQAESEPELPPAEPAPSSSHSSRDDHRGSDDSRGRVGKSGRWHRPRRRGSSRDRRSPRRDDRDRAKRGARRGLLGDRPAEKPVDPKAPPALMDLKPRPLPALMDMPFGEKPPAVDGRRSEDLEQFGGELMDVKPFGGEPPPAADARRSKDVKPFGGELPPAADVRRSKDARDAVSPRFVERDRRQGDRDRERERDRDRHSRRSEEKRAHPDRRDRRSRSRSRGAAYPPPANSSGDRRGSPPSGDYRPSSYKVNKKLEVMEKMGLQIKTPDGSMATAQQLRAAAGEPCPAISNCLMPPRIMHQVRKRKLLWGNKSKSEADEAAKWSGARFAQDNDGKQASKFLRLMGIKDPEAVKVEPAVDPIKKQEELFQAMQAQYDVARATTHTMRGVGLGFQRGQY